MSLEPDAGSTSVLTTSANAFVRQWAVEGRRIAWLLGAGASASARIPTARQITLDLLCRLYADAFGLVRQDLDLADDATRRRLEAYFDGQNGMPPLGDRSDYSTAFALALPGDGPRRQYLRRLMEGRSPSYGQRVLGALIAHGHTDLVITTNFDDLVEQAAERARAAQTSPGRSRLGVAALGDPARAGLAFTDDDFPLLIKLHGDFREHQLKNLEAELQAQDDRLRRTILDASRRFGLAVVGYSGRDASVMAMLEDAVATPDALPGGLWWLLRDPEGVSAEVDRVMRLARDAGVSAQYVRVGAFDEVLGALGRQADLGAELRAYVNGLAPVQRVQGAALPALDRGALPVLRLNALPLRAAPSAAVALTLSAGWDKERIEAALAAGRWRGSHVLSGQRMLALGDTTSLRQILGARDEAVSVRLDVFAADSPPFERSLVLAAMTRALARRLPVRPSIRDRGMRLRIRPVDRDRPDSETQVEVRRRFEDAYGDALTGECEASLGRGPDGAHRVFAEAVTLSLEWRFDTLWLLFLPATWVSPLNEAQRRSASGDKAAAWRKERWVNRRNERWAAIIDAWAQAIAPEDPTTFPAVPNSAADASAAWGDFEIGRPTAYSRVAR